MHVVARCCFALNLLLFAPINVSGASLLSKQPMHFEENRGQWPSLPRLLVHKGKRTAGLETDGISIRDRYGDLVRIEFKGASSTVTLAGEDRRATSYNYYYGNDPRSWRSNVAAYQSVLYK